MNIPTRGPIWFLIVGIPALAVTVVGYLSWLIGWRWLDLKCRKMMKQLDQD